MLYTEKYRSLHNYRLAGLIVTLASVVLIYGCPKNHYNKEEKHGAMLTQSEIEDSANKGISELKLFGKDFKVRFDNDANERWEKKLSSLLRNDAEFRELYNKKLKNRPYKVGYIETPPIIINGNRLESPFYAGDNGFVLVDLYTGKLFICFEKDEPTFK